MEALSAQQIGEDGARRGGVASVDDGVLGFDGD